MAVEGIEYTGKEHIYGKLGFGLDVHMPSYILVFVEIYGGGRWK